MRGPAKVLHLTSVHPAWDIRIFQKECRSLAAAGYHVVLAGAFGWAGERRRGGVRVVSVESAGCRLSRMLSTTRRLARVVDQEAPDLVHVHDPELVPWLRGFRRGGAHVVFDMHEDLPGAIRDKPYLPGWVRPPTSWVAERAERILLAGMPVVYAERSYVRGRDWVRRSRVVLNYPLADALLAIKARPHRALGYIGGISRARGAEDILDALVILRERGITMGLEWAGRTEPGYRAHLDTVVRLHGLEGVRSHGVLSPPEAWKTVAGCVAGLAVLHDRPNYRASMPTKVLEYLGLGIPVIASDFPLYRALVEGRRCGLVVPPGDPLAIADAVAWLLDNPKEAAAMGERGRRAVADELNWKGQAEKLIGLYRELLGDFETDGDLA